MKKMIYKIRYKIRKMLKNWLGVNKIDYRIEMIEKLIMHEKSRISGYAVLKKHLHRPDKPLPYYMGKEIEQD